MADEITQKLGLDASQAISTLRTLGSLFSQYARNVQAAAAANTAFSKSGQNLLGSINQDAKAVTDLVKTLGSLQRAQDQAAASAQKAAAAEAAAASRRTQQASAIKIQKSLGGETAGLSGDSLNQANALIQKISQVGARAGLTANQIKSIGNNLGSAFVGPQAQIAKLITQLNGIKNAGGGGSNFLSNLNTGFLAAVVSANLLSNAISKITNGLIEGVTAAVTYEKTLARIQTIAGSEVGGIEQLNKQVRALADEFGRPVTEVAAAQYELLSNQIGNAAESADVLATALKLANVTGATTPQAVNAISSVLNSYNLATSEAANISGKLFKAVDLGRFTLDQVADSLGRVTVVAAQVGVSIDEVLAALATLTVTGVPADEAMTLLGNTIRGLLKPTTEMKAVFAELGVSTAEAGIQAAGGFLPFLEKITAISGDTASEITQLTENIRVARGVIGLTGDQAERAAENLAKIKAVGADLLEQKNNIIINTNAKQVEQDLERVKNLFIVDIGRNALAAISALSAPFGGLTNVIKIAAAAAAVYAANLFAANFNAALLAAGNGLLTLSFAKVAAGAVAAGRGIVAFIATTGPIIAITVGVIALGKAIADLGSAGDKAKAALDDVFAGRAEARRKDAENTTKANQLIAEGRKQELDKSVTALQKFISDAQALYNKSAQDAIKSQQLVTENLRSQLKDRIKAYEDYVGKLEDAIKGAAKAEQDQFTNITELTRTVGQNRFNRANQGLPEGQQVFNDLNRINALRRQANDLEAQGTVQAKQQADAVRQEAASLAESAANTAKQAGDRARLKQAEDAINAVLGDQIGAELRKTALAKEAAATAQKELASQKQNLAEIKALESQIEKLQNDALKDQKLSNDERIAKFREAIPLAEEIQKRLAKAGDPDLAKKLGIGDLLKDIRKPLTDQLGKEVSIKTSFEGAAASLQAALNNKEFEIKVKPVLTELSLASGLDAEKLLNQGAGLDKIEKAIVQRAKQATQGISTGANLTELQSNVATAKDAVVRDLAKIEVEFKQLAQGVQTNAGTVTQVLQKLKAGAGELVNPSGITAGLSDQFINAVIGNQKALEIAQKGIAAAESGDTKAATAAVQQFLALSKETETSNPKLSESYRSLAGAIAQYVQDASKLQQANQQVQQGANVEGQLNTAKELLNTTSQAATEEGALASATSAAATSASAASSASSSLSGQLNSEAAAARNAAAAQRELNAARAGGGGSGAEEFSTGGLVYRALGGVIPAYLAGGGPSPFKPRGTDTVPAMLTPGEFVVNARSTRKFFSQLVAINSGRQPVFRAAGGPVTNFNIGDVNVNTQGNRQTGEVIGRDISRALNREIRRGNIRLRT